MKLSQAMRRGARVTYQIRGKYSDGIGGTCALGAIAVGRGSCLGISETVVACSALSLSTEFPELHTPTNCPSCGNHRYLNQTIVHLNDTHDWSRERIAGWIESHVEVPTYSLLQMREYMEWGEPVAVEKVVA